MTLRGAVAQLAASSPPRAAIATHLADRVGRGRHRFAIKAPWAIAIATLGFVAVSLVLSANALTQTLTSFDPPGAISTDPLFLNINPAGKIVGAYYDAAQAVHGFVRDPDGTITPFDPPGAIYTFPRAINPGGEIAGIYGVPDPVHGVVYHGFVRSRH